jgi:hypothetical protein
VIRIPTIASVADNPRPHRSGAASGVDHDLVVGHPVVEADQDLAGLLGDDRSLVVGPGEASDGVEVVEDTGLDGGRFAPDGR